MLPARRGRCNAQFVEISLYHFRMHKLALDRAEDPALGKSVRDRDAVRASTGLFAVRAAPAFT
jgi:hypothetical protein